jgi:hypothetical protein
MTANEKAATFIGWKPGMTCKEALDFSNSKRGMHWHEAPDMSRPENYMKVLEALRNRGFIWVMVYANANGDHGIEIRLKEPFSSHSHRTVVDYHGANDMGRAMIAAFAKLYDYEHPEPAEARATN